MELSELNFTEICRCCKRTESGMTSIFDGKTHPTYPPVEEMLRSIASLNVQENDGLPSLVCTSCHNIIQEAFTFILQVILIDEELWKIFHARRKQADTLPQGSTYDANCQSTSTESVEKEDGSAPAQLGANLLDNFHDSEDLHHILTVNNVDKHGTADNGDENIDLVVPDVYVPENQEANKLQLQSKSVDQLAYEVCNKRFKGTRSPEYHKPAKYSVKSEPSPSATEITLTRGKYYFESYDDIHECNSLTSVDDTTNFDIIYLANIDQDLDAAETAKSQIIRRRKTSIPTVVLNCKLCAFTSEHMHHLKEHLQIHFKDMPFSCSKCNGKFAKRGNMLRHWQKCNGDINKLKRATSSTRNTVKQVISLTLDDLEDPEKMKKYYTYTENLHVNDVKLERAEDRVDDVEMDIERICPKLRTIRRKTTSNRTDALDVFNCNLCGYVSAYKHHLKEHLQGHLKDKPFACSKCNDSFARRSNMLRHWRTCNGGFYKYARAARRKEKVLKQAISLTLQDLEDPQKVMKYYTYTENGNLLVNDEDEKLQRAEDRGDDVDIEETPDVADALDVFNCTLCAFTTARMCYLKRHFQTHCKDKPFTCSKCNGTFGRKCNMLRHWQKCNGDFTKFLRAPCRKRKAKQVISFTRQDLKDPENMSTLLTLGMNI